MKRLVMRRIWLTAFVLCFTAAACHALNTHRAWRASAACSIQAATGDSLAPLTALYPETEWTAYTQGYELLRVANDALPARGAQVQALCFLGDPERIAFFPMASGRLPGEGESGVCALDANTAYALFRDTGAEGKRVRVGGASLMVTGVIQMERSILLLPAAQDARFDRLVADTREELAALVTALGEEMDFFEFSGAEAARAADVLCAFPCALLVCFMLSALRRRVGWRRKIANLLLWAFAAAVILAVFWCVPVRLLPSRWSEFDFYARLLDAFRTRAVRLPDARDRLMRSDLVRVGAWSLLSCAALWMERKWMRCERVL